MVYATVDDLVARYGELTEAEAARAEILLADASAAIQLAGGLTELSEVQATVYRTVTCEIAHGAMTQQEYGDVSQHTQTAGSFTESFSFRSQPGLCKPNINQLKRLGLRGMRIGSIRPEAHR